MRDRAFILAVMAVACVVLLGYARAGVAGGPSQHVDFGLQAAAPRPLPRVVKKVVTAPELRGWLSGARQAAVTDAMRSNLIGFDSMIFGTADAVTVANRSFYRTFLPSQYLIPVGMDAGDAFTPRDGSRLVQVKLPRADLWPADGPDAFSARRLVARFPALHFAFYGVTQFAMTDQAVAMGYRDPTVEYRDHFARDLAGVAAVGSLRLDDWAGGFFATDHHWNPAGAYQGYLDIIGLLSQKRPEMGERRVPFAERTAAGVRFRGSESRMSALEQFEEPFRVLVLDEPALVTGVNGKTVDIAARYRRYFAHPPTSLFAPHYGSYYGADKALRSFRMRGADSSAGRLLVFSDSYGRAVVPLVATHFEQTFYVDLRYWDSTFGAPFDMASFVSEHGITDVLVMGRPLSVMSTPADLLGDGKPL